MKLVTRMPIINRDVVLANDEQCERAKRDYPQHAHRIDNELDFYVGFYADMGEDTIGSVWYTVDTYHNDPHHRTSSGYRNGRTKYATIAEAVAAAKANKNVQRRIRRVECTGRFVGSDADGWCIENGYRAEVIGERWISRGKWCRRGEI